MARACGVTQEQAVDIIISYFHYFRSDIPDYPNVVWEEMSSSCNGLWNKKSWYTNIYYNRRNILTIARERMGIVSNSDGRQLAKTKDLDHSSEELDSYLEISNIDTFGCEQNVQDEQIFNLYIPAEEWQKIKPTNDSSTKRTSNTLQAKVWTNVIALAFWKQHRLPCVYSFQKV